MRSQNKAGANPTIATKQQEVLVMLKVCARCGKLHDINSKCYAGGRPKKQDYISKFRRTNQWRVKAEQIKKRDNYLCQECKSKGIYTYNSLEVHHITKLKDDFEKRLDDDNLITLCSMCHKDADNEKLSEKHLKSLLKE